MGLLGHMAVLFLVFKELPFSFPWWLYQFRVPPTMQGPGGSAVKPDAREASVVPGWGRSPEKDMATHSSILAWRITWTGEAGRLQSTASPKSQARLRD